MTDNNGEELMTQTDAAKLRGMSLAAVNDHVRSGRWRSIVKYGKRLVYRADVIGFTPKTHKMKHTKPTAKKQAAKRQATKATKKTTKKRSSKVRP